MGYLAVAVDAVGQGVAGRIVFCLSLTSSIIVLILRSRVALTLYTGVIFVLDFDFDFDFDFGLGIDWGA